MTTLVQQMLSGDRLALARLISRVEGRSRDLISIMSRVQARCGKAYTIGVTGPPGAGKSTLADRLIAHLRRKGKKVGVIAIDPSSPFSGGAVLGDRIRMQDHAGDEGVFIRSLGSRGNRGGLSRATREVVKLYDAFGMNYVLVETVGVGQNELDVMEIADTTVVILTPESGDTIQTMKAGLLEIADLFVVNKADRDGAQTLQAELKSMLEYGGKEGHSGWQVPVLLTEAIKDQGIVELLSGIEDHRAYLKDQGLKGIQEKKKKIAFEEVREIVLDQVRDKISHFLNGKVSRIMNNPYEAATSILSLLEKKLWQKSKPLTRRPQRSSRKSSRQRKKRSGGR